jgi:hypothetical protein
MELYNSNASNSHFGVTSSFHGQNRLAFVAIFVIVNTSERATEFDVTERRRRVGSTPLSYSGGLGFKHLPEDGLFLFRIREV